MGMVAILQRIEESKAATQALVLVPTRDLSFSIQKVASALCGHMRVTSHYCDIGDDLNALHENPHFVVGTPGRVREMIAQCHLRLEDLTTVVLDEMDEMISHGYKGPISETMESLPQHVQIVVFSESMSPEVLEHVNSKMRDLRCISISPDELTLEGIRQFYVAIEKEEWKLDTLCDFHETLAITCAIIYANTRNTVDFLAQELSKRDLTSLVIHADLNQQQRDLVMREFRSGSSRILLSTDLITRGIDVQSPNVIINYDLPSNMENYLSRIGRSRRFPRQNPIINFVTPNDVPTMKDIERYYHTQIEEMPTDIGDLI